MNLKSFSLSEQIQQATKILQGATSAVALTGAGISTPSGIPDFRSPDSGFWERVDPMKVASLPGFKRRPEAFYNWVRPLIDVSLEAQSNPAHYALRDLEAHGPLDGIITQNIDTTRKLALHGFGKRNRNRRRTIRR